MSPQETTRRRVIHGAAIGGSAALAGCIGLSRDDSGPQASPSSAENDVEDLDIWGWDVAARALSLTAGAFEDERDMSVSVSELARDTMKSNFLDAIRSGEGKPDVAMMEYIDGPTWIGETNGIRDVSDRIGDAGLEGDFVSGTWQSLTVDDGVYAVPWDIGPVGVFYRRSIYESHDIDVDAIETWDDIIEYGSSVPDDVYLLNIPAGDYDGFWRWQLRQEGEQPITQDGEINIDSAVSLDIARTLVTLLEENVAERITPRSPTWYRQLREGTLASIISGSWMAGTLRATLDGTAGDWGVYLPPAKRRGGPRASNWGGSSLVVPAGLSDERADAAWEFVRFALANEDMQRRMYREYGLFPAYEPTYETDLFDDEDEFFGGQQVTRLFADAATEIEGYRFSEHTGTISRAINEHFESMLDGETTPEAALEAAAQQVADETGLDRAN